MSATPLNVLLVSSSCSEKKATLVNWLPRFVDALQASGHEHQLTHHDLVERDLPHLGAAEMQAWMTPADEAKRRATQARRAV